MAQKGEEMTDTQVRLMKRINEKNHERGYFGID